MLEEGALGIDDYWRLLGEPVTKGKNALFDIMYKLPPSFFYPQL